MLTSSWRHFIRSMLNYMVLTLDVKSQFWMDSIINLLYILICPFSLYIGDNAATMKVHLLCHVVPCVRYWGPLWAYSCFLFEAMNQQSNACFMAAGTWAKRYSWYHFVIEYSKSSYDYTPWLLHTACNQPYPDADHANNNCSQNLRSHWQSATYSQENDRERIKVRRV